MKNYEKEIISMNKNVYGQMMNLNKEDTQKILEE